MSRLKILVADDTPDRWQLYRILLLEHDVEICSSAGSALQAIDWRFDVLIASWGLADGCELLLREAARRNNPPHRVLHAEMEPEELERLTEERIIDAFFPGPSWQDVCRYITQHSSALPAPRSGRGDNSPVRAAERVTTRVTAFIRCREWNDLRQFYTEDLSQDGLSLSSDRELASGTRIGIGLVLPEGDRLHLSGVVRHATESAPQGRWKIGVKLDRPNERKRMVLRALLRRNLSRFADPDSEAL